MNCGGAALWQGQLYCVAGAVFVFSWEFLEMELLEQADWVAQNLM